MTTSPVPLPVRARVRRRHNRRVSFILISRRLDARLTDFFWAHQTPMVLLTTVMAGVIIAVVARTLLTLGGI
jgi:hypothetical protein